MLDVYHKWLGIPPEDQPPDHYRLLGINRFESNLDVISAAADRQMTYLRSLQSGPHAGLAQELLNEVTLARICLLDSQQRSRYDDVLKSAVPADSVSSLLPPPVNAAPKPSALARGDSLGSYQLLDLTSTVSATVCYKAQDARNGGLVTLKTLTPAAAKSEQVVKRFRREIELTTKLDHANLIIGLDHGEHAGVPYLVLEYVVGTDLATLVKHHGALPVDQAVAYAVQAARGLTQLHFHRVFHRNIKPRVLLIDVQGNLKVSDLLLARIAESSDLAGGREELTRKGQTMGTSDYMSPEQAEDAHQADARSDIYSLGCTLFFLLTARPPYKGKSNLQKLVAHRNEPVPSLCAERPEVPPGLDQVFRKMVAKDPAARYQFMGDVIDDLETSIEQPLFKRLISRMRPSR